MKKTPQQKNRTFFLAFLSFCLMAILTGCQSRQPQEPTALQVFGQNNYQGENAFLEPRVIYAGEKIPKGLDKNISSLILKKGYQLCMATGKNGKGPSKVLIAAKRDIRIPKLSAPFNNKIRFIRVLPWKNVIKKGICGKNYKGLNAGWYYKWGGMGKTTDKIQWTPMAFYQGHSKPERIKLLVETDGIQDLLAFNEIDHNGHQGAKDGYLFKQENAVKEMGNLMTAGLRLGGPSLRENGPRDWLPKFRELSKKQNVRMDFLAVHWYDWGGIWKENQFKKNKQGHKVPAYRHPKQIFARFKGYLKQVHEKNGKLPIWITEFNANPKRDTKTQIEFLKLALPYLDNCPYVERYAYFQPFGGKGKFREGEDAWGKSDKPLTELGKMWRDHPSTPAMDKDVYLGRNNLFEDEVEESK